MSTGSSFYKSMFNLALHKYGYEFAKWFVAEVYERRAAAFYDLDEAFADWESAGRPVVVDEYQ